MADSSKKPTQDLGIEYGDSGVRIFNGIIVGDEYRPELHGRALMRTVEEMRRGDATVMAGLNAVKMPIVAAEWFVEIGGDTAQDKEASDLTDHVFNNILNWKNLLQEILTMLEFGYSVFEIVVDIRTVDGVDRLVPVKIAYRKQTTIYAWQTQDGRPGITQFKSTGEMISIPEEKLVTFTHQQEGDNWEGISILRAAYQNWYYKKTLYQIDAVGHERQSLGVVKIKYPVGATDPMRQEARLAAQNVRANERAYIEEPNGWDINFMDMKANTTKDPTESIAHHDRQILKNMAVQYLDIGSSKSSGSRSSSGDQRQLLELQDQAIAYQIASKVSEKIVKMIVDLNFNLTSYPKWQVGKIADDNIKVLSDAMKTLADSNFLTPTTEDEEHIRKVLRLPELSDTMIEQGRTSGKGAADAAAADTSGTDVKQASSILATAIDIRNALNEQLYGSTDTNAAA